MDGDAERLPASRAFEPIDLVARATMLALYVGFLVRARRSLRAVRGEQRALGGTLRESAAAALRTIELQIENARIAAYAIPAFVAVSGWFLLVKYLAGVFPGHGVVWGLAFMVLVAAAIGGAVWRRCRTRLMPRRTELRGLLRSLTEE